MSGEELCLFERCCLVFTGLGRVAKPEFEAVANNITAVFEVRFIPQLGAFSCADLAFRFT